jgi:hypothetical protein
VADNGVHYVAHIRLEKVTRGEATSAPAGRGGAAKVESTRQVEELTNVVQKGQNFDDLVGIVTQILDISKRAANLS